MKIGVKKDFSTNLKEAKSITTNAIAVSKAAKKSLTASTFVECLITPT